ncbi:MAG: NUMOD4 domain-containing protein [Salinisphaeraceae bacterium]
MERWATVVDFPDYAVSTLGRVKRLTSHKRAMAGAVLKQFLVCGYPSVNLCRRDGYRRSIRVHRLVAEAFIPVSEGATEVNHIDGSRDRNTVENLEWVTATGNRLHAYRVGRLSASGEDNGQSKLTEEDVSVIRTSTDSPAVLANRYGVSRGTIYDIRARRSRNHLPAARGGLTVI